MGVIALVILAASATPGGAARPPTGDAAVWRHLRGEWRAAGGGITWEFYLRDRGVPPPDRALCRTDWDNEAQQDKYGVRLDAAADPMRLDLFYSDGRKEFVSPGVFGLDGDRLVWVSGPWVPAPAAGDAPGRPKGLGGRGQRLVLTRIPAD